MVVVLQGCRNLLKIGGAFVRILGVPRPHKKGTFGVLAEFNNPYLENVGCGTPVVFSQRLKKGRFVDGVS